MSLEDGDVPEGELIDEVLVLLLKVLVVVLAALVLATAFTPLFQF